LRILIVDAPKSLNEKFMMDHGWNAIFTLIAVALTVVGIRMLP
jgi:hypothetical protein